MYFFKGKTGDLDNMQSLLNSDKQGYIICPVWTEDVTGVLDNPDENPSIRGSGTIEFFIKEAPLSIALNITPWEEDAIGYRETGFIPFVYDTTYTQAVKNWLLSVRELRPYTVRTFFCYFDKRSKEEIAAQKEKGKLQYSRIQGRWRIIGNRTPIRTSKPIQPTSFSDRTVLAAIRI